MFKHFLALLSLAICVKQGLSDAGCYGNVSRIVASGASSATARQDNISYSGVRASEQMARVDLSHVNEYKTYISMAASALCVDPAIIAAIISRETRGGTGLNKEGYGRYDSNGYGLMQVDKQFHKTLHGGPRSFSHIIQGTLILIKMIDGVGKKHKSWNKDQILKGGISAYNAGVGNVRTYSNMDGGTTGNDYSNDVVARAKFFKRNGY